MSTPTEADVDAMLERADAATPGPWLLDRPPDKDGWATGMIVAATYRGQNVYSTHGSVAPEANRRFIAHARTDVPKLVTALREAWATIARERLPDPRTALALRVLAILENPTDAQAATIARNVRISVRWPDNQLRSDRQSVATAFHVLLTLAKGKTP